MLARLPVQPPLCLGFHNLPGTRKSNRFTNTVTSKILHLQSLSSRTVLYSVYGTDHAQDQDPNTLQNKIQQE